MANEKTCEECRRALRIGDHVVVVRRGVIGTRGFIPLEEGEYYCDEKCLRKALCGKNTIGEDLRVDDLDRHG